MRIILADPHSQALWALKTNLQEEPGIEVVGEAVDAKRLLNLAEEHSVDLILVDSGLPGNPIGDLIATLHALKPKPIVIVMSSRSEDGRMALMAGADAFVSKGDQPEWLLNTLRQHAKQMKQMEKPISACRTEEALDQAETAVEHLPPDVDPHTDDPKEEG
jgi:DNA-binding NarL/FixJ family response regulator